MVFTTIIVTRSVQYRLSVPRVTTKNSPEKPTGKPTKTNFYRTRRKVRHKTKNLYNSTLPTMQITMLTTSTDKIQSPNSFSVDTDGVYFIIDNSANGGICNIKSMFVGDFENQKVTLITAEGKTTTIKKVGTIRLVLKDDAGINWSYDIPDVVYDPESPYSLLGIPFLGRYFAQNDEANEFDNDTWIRSASTNSLFQWDHGKHQQLFAHGSSHLPELLTNEGETYFRAFCTRISKFMDDKINYAFSSAFTMSPDSVPQPHVIPNDDDEIDEVIWYTPAHTHQNKNPNKCVRFSESTKPPTPIPHEISNIDFKLGMTITYKSGKGMSENVVYEGVTSNGLEHIIRHVDGTRSHVDQCHLSLLNQIGFENIPKTPLDYCQEVGIGISQEQAQRLAYPRTFSPHQQELMSWHHRLYHLPFHRIFMLAKQGYLPKILLKLQDKLPLCVACQFGTAQRRPWRNKSKKNGSIRKPDQIKPGDGVSVDQIISAQPGLIPQMAGFLTSKRIWGCTTFVDHVSDYIYVHLMKDLTLPETLLAKMAFEKLCARSDRSVKHYHADNGRFSDTAFLAACNNLNQTIEFCGVRAHHQNGIVENRNKQLTQVARVLLLHGMRMWPQMVDQMFWPFAIKAAAERINSLHIDTEGNTPESKFHGINIENIPVKSYHTMFCPCYVLDSRLHNAGSIGPPKWEPRSNIRVYLGHSPFHAGSVALVYNPSTGHVSPQYHVVFDDDFTTVSYMETGTIPPHWPDLVHSSSEMASKQAFNLTEAWLGSTGQDNSDLKLTDNPVVDPFTIVTDHHTSNKSAHLVQKPEKITTQKQPSTTAVLLQTEMAVSEGGTLTLGSKRPLISAHDSVPPASQAASSTSQGRDLTPAPGNISEPSTAQSVDELKLPPRLNLRESGLRRSERIKALQQKANEPAHITWGT